MKSVTVETASLTDAVNRAARIAPTKGSAFDLASGVQLELRPGTNAELRVLATDIESTFWTRVKVVSIEDEPCDFRVPAQLLSGWLSNLPMGAGNTVKLTEKAGQLAASSGRSRVNMRVITDPLPKFALFSPEGMSNAATFGTRINQVAWAVHAKDTPFNGIHITGDYLIACDRQRVAFLPCDVPVEAPVTAPLRKLASLLKNTLDVKLRATETRLEIMPDADTQMTCGLILSPYPDARRAVAVPVPHTYLLPKTEFVDALNRMLVLVQGERYPKLHVTACNDEINLRMNLEGVGEMTDDVTVTSEDGSVLDAFEFDVSPINFLAALQNASREAVTLHLSGDAKRPMRFTDESEYDAWIMPVVIPGSSA